jgi:methionyl-tRNA formyltransferase
MRFAITMSDRYLGVFEALLNAGWQPVRLFGAPTDGRLSPNRASIDRACALKIGIQLSRMSERDLKYLAEEECEVLVVASYPWRIGDWQRFLPHAINFHPSPLPECRGPYPLVNALLEKRTRWGVTCHKLAPEFDTGDILAQRTFDVDEQETHETLDLKTQMATATLARHVAQNFAALWAGATRQGEGSYAPLFSQAERTLDFGKTVEQILRTVRAFGRFECLACINEVLVHVARAAGWRETHDVRPGTVVHSYALSTVVACRDGFIALLDWHLFSPNTITGTPMR